MVHNGFSRAREFDAHRITQHWADGDANEGILLTSTNGDGVDYNASEGVRGRPSLTVQFVPPAQIPGMTVLSELCAEAVAVVEGDAV